jgi:hypothetical protein
MSRAFPDPNGFRLTGLDFVAGHHDVQHERDREDHDGRGEAYLDGNVALAVGSLQVLLGGTFRCGRHFASVNPLD